MESAMKNLCFLILISLCIHYTSYSQEDENQKNKWELGFGLGTPAMINLNLVYHFEDFYLRGSGLPTGGETYGYHFDFGYKLYEVKSTYHSLTTNIGTYQYPPNNSNYSTGPEGATRNYLGFSYLFSTRGFYIQIGMSTGSGTPQKNPGFILAMGYNLRF